MSKVTSEFQEPDLAERLAWNVRKTNSWSGRTAAVGVLTKGRTVAMWI
jgi:hypothetical protein